MCLVTVIIPTRNRADWLARAVESALAQNARGAVEVVVVDDGSDPPVSAVCDARVRLIRHPVGRGGSAARNAGLRAARGAWITSLDDEDELLPG